MKDTVTDIMIDMEFLSLDFNAIILSIGVVGFNIDAENFKALSSKYWVPMVDSQKGRSVDASTLKFWMDAPQDAKRPIFEIDHEKPMLMCLSELTDFVKRTPNLKRLWSHGAACDIPLLAHTFNSYDLPIPWHYRAPRDTRTLFDYCNTKSMMELDTYGPKHHALWDALRQAEAVHAAHTKLKGALAL